MRQETAPKSESTVTATDCTTEDDGIIIRRYEPLDEEQVKNLFRTGMESNIGAAYAAIVKHPSVALPLTSLPAVVAGAVMNSSIGKRSSFWVAAATVLPATGLYYFLKYKFGNYIQASVEDDLSNIEEVYSGKGCFLVAVDTLAPSENTNGGAGSIVGIVGGHARDDGVIELRRMSVSKQQRGVGLGTRLIQRLEEECKPSTKSMYLTCISIQYAAHRLYSRAGFLRKETYTPTTASWWFRNSIEVYRYEKDFQGGI
jgi:GNAT superfamily N-acetyltransferase